MKWVAFLLLPLVGAAVGFGLAMTPLGLAVFELFGGVPYDGWEVIFILPGGTLLGFGVGAGLGIYVLVRASATDDAEG